MTIDGAVQVARPGLVAIVPSYVRHSAKALTDGLSTTAVTEDASKMR
jgi:quercetin dioxygenase-like cupin family protein